jgi:hypothetical protein
MYVCVCVYIYTFHTDTDPGSRCLIHIRVQDAYVEKVSKSITNIDVHKYTHTHAHTNKQTNTHILTHTDPNSLSKYKQGLCAWLREWLYVCDLYLVGQT